MKKFKLVFCSIGVMVALSGCGKKSSDDTTTTTTAPAASIAAAYSTISTSTGKLKITAYTGTSLALADNAPKASFDLADETWTNTEWTTARFNCYGTCASSPTGMQYVADALNKAKPGPMGTVVSSMASFCYIGAMLGASDLDSAGLPTNGTHTVTYTDAMGTSLKNDCSMSDSTVAMVKGATVTIEVADSTVTAFDKLVTFKLVGGSQTQSYPVYYKNSSGKVGIGQFSATGDATNGIVTHSIMMQDVTNNVFRMEYFYRTFPATATATTGGLTGGSYSFYRGFYDKTAGEVRFLANMGNSYYQTNNTFVGLSTNDSEATAGAYLARTSTDNTALTGAFVCFKKADGTFVNGSGCVENASNTRKNTWNATSAMWVAVTAKGFGDWSSTAVDIPAFDGTTMFTLEPNYK